MLWNKPLSLELSWLKCTKLVAAITLLTNVSCSPGNLIISPHNRIVSSVLFSLNSCGNACYMYAGYRFSVPLVLRAMLSWFNTKKLDSIAYAIHSTVFQTIGSLRQLITIRHSTIVSQDLFFTNSRGKRCYTGFGSPGQAIIIEHAGFPGRWIQSIRWLLCRLLGQ